MLTSFESFFAVFLSIIALLVVLGLSVYCVFHLLLLVKQAFSYFIKCFVKFKNMYLFDKFVDVCIGKDKSPLDNS